MNSENHHLIYAPHNMFLWTSTLNKGHSKIKKKKKGVHKLNSGDYEEQNRTKTIKTKQVQNYFNSKNFASRIAK